MKLRSIRQTGGPRSVLAAVLVLVLGWSACAEEPAAPTSPLVPSGPELIAVSALFDAPEDEVAPAHSPDGTQIAFCRGIKGTDMHIYARSLASGDETQITNHDTARECSPSWSPDGSALVYDDFNDLFVASIGGATEQLTSGVGQQVFPAWSPDGASIAYSGLTTDLGFGQFEIFIRSMTGGVTRRLTTTTIDESEPCWSADGSKLAFRVGGGPNTDIVIYDVADSTFAQITRHVLLDLNPSFSPDGRYLTWTSTRTGSAEIWVVDVEDLAAPGTPVQLTSSFGASDNADWAPDGESIVFACTRRGNGWDIFLGTGLAEALAMSSAGARAARR